MGRSALVLLLSTMAGCGHVDLTKPIDGSLGVPLGVYSQRGEMISRWELAEQLKKDVTVAAAVKGHDPWAYTGVAMMVTGAITGAVGIGMSQDQRRNDDAGLYVGLTGLGIFVLGLGADLIARLYLDDAIDLHNRQLLGFAGDEVGKERLDPYPELDDEDDDEEWP